MPSEQVLCLKRGDLPSSWLLPETALPLDFSAASALLSRANLHWQPRRTVETDSSYKQLVPYVVVQNAGSTMTAAYQREGSEARLHGLWSIGVGGHINPEDGRNTANSIEALLEHGMRRELQEELACNAATLKITFLGIINEEQTPVGRVHLGLVHHICLHPEDMQQAGPELTHFRWRPTAELTRLPLELWSRLALTLIRT